MKRARIAETPSSLERATAAETPIKLERATNSETPTTSERAIAVETPRKLERASNSETPIESERARIVETPRESERAKKSETPIASERATMSETPTGGERFSSATLESLKTLLRVYYDYQKERMALDGRLGLKKNGEEKKGTPVRDPIMLAVLYERRTQVLAMEEAAAKEIVPFVRKLGMWKYFFKGLHGCGEIMAAVCLTEFDIRIATTSSKMCQFAGLNPGQHVGKVWKGKGKKRHLEETTTMNRGDKYTKGFVRPYNAFLKSKLIGVLANEFIMSASPYRIYYDDRRHRLESKNWGEKSKNPSDPTKPKAFHQSNAAKRYMIKQFIRDLYVAWRTFEGLPVRGPYSEEYLGKKHNT